MNTNKCPNCGYENRNTNIICESCGKELNNANYTSVNQKLPQLDEKTIDAAKKRANLISNIILIFILGLPFLVGIVFIGVSLYFNITENYNSKNYLKTEGKLVDFDNCQYNNENETCNAIYEYVVNGITYTGSSNVSSNRSDFKQTITVKYNPNDSSEYVINSDFNYLLITGIIIIAVDLLIFVSVKKSINKVFDKLYSTKKGSQVSNT